MSELILTVEQTQSLSQRAIQKLEILQMNAQELETYLNEIMIENPVIDQDSVMPIPEDIKININSSDDDYSDYKTTKTNGSDTIVNPFDTLAASPENTLTDYLIFQLIPHFHTEMDKSIFYYIIESLDENGFLTIDEDYLCKFFSISEESAHFYIDTLQSMEPNGIGAKDVKSCLILQLKRVPSSTANLAITILENHMDELAANQIKYLSRLLDESCSDISDAIALIKSLNPRPANGFSCDSFPSYIQPDVIILQQHNNFQININGNLSPGFKINNYYKQMLNHPDKSVREYLYQKYQQAEWINKCLEQRNQTLLKVTQQILINQKPFFLKGPDYLCPLIQSEISRQLDISASTVSRAIHDKSLECFWGVFPFKYFFSKAANSDEANMTLSQLKQVIKTIIDSEDQKHPLSDQKIVGILENQGIKIARRTVAKYRKELLIPDTSRRRVL